MRLAKQAINNGMQVHVLYNNNYFLTREVIIFVILCTQIDLSTALRVEESFYAQVLFRF